MRKLYLLPVTCILACSMCFNLVGCDKNTVDPMETCTTLYSSEIPEPIVSDDSTNTEENVEIVDYSDCFNGIEGCAVFCNSNQDSSKVYQQELCDQEASPCSTFKIISTLMGLKQGVLTSLDTKMGYDGSKYAFDTWNTDLGLKDAFQQSCVWYFKKVIEGVGQDEVQKQLDALNFGNCDISEWDGSGVNEQADTNGFWLESSLEISPNEWVKVLADIFDGNTDYTQEQIDMLMECMLIQDEDGISVYGKTGTGKSKGAGASYEEGQNQNAWFVGFTEKDDTKEREYFAVHLTDTESDEISGATAKEIALNIIETQNK